MGCYREEYTKVVRRATPPEHEILVQLGLKACISLSASPAGSTVAGEVPSSFTSLTNLEGTLRLAGNQIGENGL